MLQTVLDQRLRDVETVDLPRFLNADPGLRQASSALRAMMFRSRDRMYAALTKSPDRERLVSKIAGGMLRYLTDEYQFLDIADVDAAALNGIYGGFAEDLLLATDNRREGAFSRSVEAALIKHHTKLLAWVENELRRAGALEAILASGAAPICEQYRPEFQLAVLAIDAESIAGPVLDLGCGAEGRLTRYLMGRGHADVLGVDRNASAPGMLRDSWFEAPLPPGFWSLIVAHQSFSLHLLHAHLTSAEQASRYAAHYMKILQALRAGGRFAYAPNLPFLEALLPRDQFRVRAHAGPAAHLAQAPKAFRALYAASGLGSATVERIAG